ncbi:hypothetical protein ACTJI8_14595 [Microbacterium sp. 22303]|uniref:hypothetical protein n=1 Tax=Microbacterium sp. 22303 TaxID=3453905 RepID=UPI003F826C16
MNTKGSATAASRPRLGEGFVLGLIATGAVSVAIAALVAIVLRAVALFGLAPTILLPMHDGGTVKALAQAPAVLQSDYASAHVTVEGIPFFARLLLVLEGALPALATIGVCAVAWWLGVSLIRSRPFRRSMSTAIGIAACLVMVGGVLGQLAGAIGRAAVVDHLSVGDPSVTHVLWPFLLELDLAPLGWGFALALIATAFQLGARLQQDAEGLV